MPSSSEIKCISYLNEEGELSPSFSDNIPDDLLIQGLKIMLLTRRVDERMITLQRQGGISFALSSYGEESCSVATAAGLEIEDWIYPQYREVGAIFWRGFKIVDYIH